MCTLYHGASRLLEGEIIGEDAHAARPHLGINAIEVGATIIEDLRTIHTDPMVPVSVKMTKFHAGEIRAILSQVMPHLRLIFVHSKTR